MNANLKPKRSKRKPPTVWGPIAIRRRGKARRTAKWRAWKAEQLWLANEAFVRKHYPDAKPGDHVIVSLPIDFVLTGIWPRYLRGWL
jgi:hypothetical protein